MSFGRVCQFWDRRSVIFLDDSRKPPMWIHSCTIRLFWAILLSYQTWWRALADSVSSGSLIWQTQNLLLDHRSPQSTGSWDRIHWLLHRPAWEDWILKWYTHNYHPWSLEYRIESGRFRLGQSIWGFKFSLLWGRTSNLPSSWLPSKCSCQWSWKARVWYLHFLSRYCLKNASWKLSCPLCWHWAQSVFQVLCHSCQLKSSIGLYSGLGGKCILHRRYRRH